MTRKITLIVLILGLLMMFSAVAPVMAIGPWQALEVGNNPNLWTVLGALKNRRGEAVGNIVWTKVYGVCTKMSFFDTVSGQGKANNAIIATMSTLAQFQTDFSAYVNGEPTVNENKWIILSPEGSGNQYLGHGMLWWLFYLGYGQSAADYVVVLYPDGVYWMYNFIQ